MPRSALTRLHDWRLELRTCPAKGSGGLGTKAILYSFHPKGSYRFVLERLGWLRSRRATAADAQPQVQCLWILPIGSVAIMSTGLLQAQEGIGTEDEYRQLVKTAHQLGFNVWQDIVPHGINTYQRAKRISEWLVKRKTAPRSTTGASTSTGAMEGLHERVTKALRQELRR